MKKPRSIFVALLLLGFGVSLAVPTEDVPETAYDESEALPYECTSQYSTIIPSAAVRKTPSPLNPFHSDLQALSTYRPAHGRDVGANRFASARALSALLCVLLC